MSSPTTQQLGQFSRVQPPVGLAEDQPTIDQLLPIIPWRPAQGHEQRLVAVTRVNLGTARWADAGDATVDDPAVPTVPATVIAMARIYRDIILDGLLLDTRSEDVDLAQMEVDAGLRTILYALGSGLINGDALAVPAQIKGFQRLASAGQTVGAADDNPNGGAVTLADFDRLRNLVTAGGGGPIVLVGNLATYQKWQARYYAAGLLPQVGFICPQHCHVWEEAGDPAEICSDVVPVLLHQGVPFLVSEHIPSNETKGTGTNLTSVYLVMLGGEDGAALIYPARLAGTPFKVERIVNPFGDQERYRMVLTVGLRLGSPAALARLNGISNS